jgi:hypothetical protein
VRNIHRSLQDWILDTYLYIIIVVIERVFSVRFVDVVAVVVVVVFVVVSRAGYVR